MTPKLLLPLVFLAGVACSAQPNAPPPVASHPRPLARGSTSASARFVPAPSSSSTEASGPAPTAYDRDADVVSRQTEAKNELGSRAESELVEDSFLIVTPKGKGALAGPIDITRRALAAYFNGRFSTRPERVVSVYLFPDDGGYQGFCKSHWEKKCSSPYGFYLAEDRKIIMNVGLGIGTLTHELVHPLVEADFPKAPDWINEGIASLFEQFYLPRPGEIHGGKNWRLPRLRSGLSSKKERDIAVPSALFGMSDEVFRGDKEDLHYATARYLCQWLDEKGLLWAFYQRFRDHVGDDPSGASAFEAVVGKPPADVDTEFTRWVRAL